MQSVRPLNLRDARQTNEPREMNFLKKWQYPEVALFGSRKEAAQAFQRSPWSYKWIWLVIIASGAGPLLLGRLPASLLALVDLRTSLGFPVYCLATLFVALFWNAIIWTLWFVFVRKPVRRYLRECLVAQGVPICVDCGYDLRGQTEPRCPECGKPFDERLLHRAQEGPSNQTDSPH